MEREDSTAQYLVAILLSVAKISTQRPCRKGDLQKTVPLQDKLEYIKPEFGIRLSLLYRNESYFHGRDDSVHSQIAMNNIYSCKEYFCLF